MIPAWISPESWDAFVEMRKKIKAPLTIYAGNLIIRELVKLKSSGEDPQACLDQSIRNGWRDVFPLRDKALRVSTVAPEVQKAHSDAYERQLAASIAAMKRA
jgi:hypothetical protein